MNQTGRVWKFGDNVNTDLIYPGRYTYQMLSPEEMASHALEGIDPLFGKEDMTDGIIVAGENFGCGSAREQAVQCLKMKHIRIIIAKSFARIYFRNCINEGILPIVCAPAVEAIENGEKIAVDMDQSMIVTQKGQFPFGKLPEYLRQLLEAGGLIAVTRKEIQGI